MKGKIINVFVFMVIVCVATTRSFCSTKAAIDVNKWGSLCSNRTLFTKEGGSLPIRNVQQSILHQSYNLLLMKCVCSFNSLLNYMQVTYLGKELLKYVSEEVPIPPESDLVPQQHQLCLPGMCTPTPIP